jgi:hypothetical protein
MTTMEKPASTWSFDQGTLTVRHLGKTVSLGRYATYEFAAKAAAVYFAKHGAAVVCRNHDRRLPGRSQLFKGSPPVPEWYVIFDATAHET